jgi:hypothetical protein
MAPNDFLDIFETINLQRIAIQQKFLSARECSYCLSCSSKSKCWRHIETFLNKATRNLHNRCNNQMFNIYDKKTKQSTLFILYVTNATIIHRSIQTHCDCMELSEAQGEKIATKMNDWQFKIHVIICEMNAANGAASFPNMFEITNPNHNLSTYFFSVTKTVLSIY